jgi:hypothetical protein
MHQFSCDEIGCLRIMHLKDMSRRKAESKLERKFGWGVLRESRPGKDGREIVFTEHFCRMHSSAAIRPVDDGR